MELDNSLDIHSHVIAVPTPTVLFVSLLLSRGPNLLLKTNLGSNPSGVENVFSIFHFISIGDRIFGIADSAVIVVRLIEAICSRLLDYFYVLSCLYFSATLGMVHAPKDQDGASIPLHLSLDRGYALRRDVTRTPCALL